MAAAWGLILLLIGFTLATGSGSQAQVLEKVASSIFKDACVSYAEDSASLVALLTSTGCKSRYIMLSPDPPDGYYRWPSFQAIQSSQVVIEALASEAEKPSRQVVVRCPSDGLIFKSRGDNTAFLAKNIHFQVCGPKYICISHIGWYCQCLVSGSGLHPVLC